MKGLAKEHICITQRHRQRCGNGQEEGRRWRGKGGEVGKGEEHGEICNSVHNKGKAINKEFLPTKNKS